MRAVLTVFDGHNDTLTRDDADDFATGREGGHVDLPRAKQGGLGGGIFAAFTGTPGDQPPDGEPAAPVGQELAAGLVTRTLGRLLKLEREGHVALARGPGDLDAAREAGTFAAVAHIEGAEAVDPGLLALDVLHAAGLRSLGPVWSRPNAFAHGVPFAYPSSPDTGPGLTPAGTRLVRRCAELGIAVDLSHLNEAGFWDVARLGARAADRLALRRPRASAPPAATSRTPSSTPSAPAAGSSASSTRSPSSGRTAPRTPTRRWRRSPRTRATSPTASASTTSRSARTSTERRSRSALGDVTGLPRLLDALRGAGFDEDELERIAWGNWRRVLEAAWGG